MLLVTYATFVTGTNAHPGNFAAGFVFVGTNHNNTHPTAPSGEPANQVVMYNRAADGRLSLVGTFDTGGQGSGPAVRFAGDGLGSAHSVELSHNRRWLFVTNAGSNNVTVFRVKRHGLQRTDLEATGVFPNSVTQHGHLVYVLNSAGEGSITGYVLDNRGDLTPIPGSTRRLHANQNPVRPDVLFNPAQVSFTPDGQQLVVTIKDGPAAGALPNVTPTGSGRILVFNVERNGLPSIYPTQTNLNNLGPFGFSFDRFGHLLVSLFVGGPNLTGSAGSFRITQSGGLIPITPNVPNTQIDTCWLENNGRYAFGANYSSGTISSYRIGYDGSLKLLAAVAGITDDLPGPPGKVQGSTPLDIGISTNGRFLYNVLPGSGAIAGWRINSDGSLTKIGEFGGLPDAVNGDMAPFEFGPGGSPAGIAVD
ncbi:beta-propeller fold lactonase family protein [Nostoc sp. CHAB 5844]|nr:beta-propeller fold lactonase family protein [Nostoc sp. CHAB 5844]